MEITKSMYLLAKKIVAEYEEKPKPKTIKKTIEERKNDFMESIRPFVLVYPEPMLQDFYNYWSEHGKNDKKFRMEKEKSFNVELRLKTWHKRSKQYNQKSVSLAEQMRLDHGINNP